MPELPDLLHINTHLRDNVRGRAVAGAAVRQPVVVRNPFPEPFEDLVRGATIAGTAVRGPFLVLSTNTGRMLVLNLMLAGHLHHLPVGSRAPGWLCLTLALDDGTSLHLADETAMAKVYLARPGATAHIPRFDAQGIDVLSERFTPEEFARIAARHRRRQVRVLLTDQTALSAIGNAYADEILFEARIHPKTLVGRLGAPDLEALYRSIRSELARGIQAVAAAARPIHVKVRDHMRVRNRRGAPCVRCGTTIRREGVRGYDVFFCPSCQPATRRTFIDWRRAGDGGSPEG